MWKRISGKGGSEVSKEHLGEGPARETQVGSAIIHMDKACEDLGAVVERLESRLADVLRPRDNSKGEGSGGNVKATPVPLVIAMDRHYEAIAGVIHHINDIIGRTEL